MAFIGNILITEYIQTRVNMYTCINRHMEPQWLSHEMNFRNYNHSHHQR